MTATIPAAITGTDTCRDTAGKAGCGAAVASDAESLSRRRELFDVRNRHVVEFIQIVDEALVVIPAFYFYL